MLSHKMATKKVTVCWSTVVEVELPDWATLDDLKDSVTNDITSTFVSHLVRRAFDNLTWQTGEITDVQSYGSER